MIEDTDSFINKDWFGPAIIENGSVGQCLEAVEKLLAERMDLIAQIKCALVPSNPSTPSDTVVKTDNLTNFGKSLVPLEQTIMARVGVLRPENVSSWYRAPAASAKGPFQSEQLQLSVFGRHHIKDFKSVKKSIQKCWENNSIEPLFFDPEGTIWGAILKAKIRFSKTITLNGGYSGYTLMNIPENIESKHLSPSLKAFFRNVRVEVLNLNRRLESLYDVLWATCEKFWGYHESKIKEDNASSKGSSSSCKSDASRMRDAFKQRRAAAQIRVSSKTKKELRALNIMGFEALPKLEELKKKYRELARAYHPDAGGDEIKFKELTESYNYLSDKISSTVEFLG